VCHGATCAGRPAVVRRVVAQGLGFAAVAAFSFSCWFFDTGRGGATPPTRSCRPHRPRQPDRHAPTDAIHGTRAPPATRPRQEPRPPPCLSSRFPSTPRSPGGAATSAPRRAATHPLSSVEVDGDGAAIYHRAVTAAAGALTARPRRRPTVGRRAASGWTCVPGVGGSHSSHEARCPCGVSARPVEGAARPHQRPTRFHRCRRSPVAPSKARGVAVTADGGLGFPPAKRRCVGKRPRSRRPWSRRGEGRNHLTRRHARASPPSAPCARPPTARSGRRVAGQGRRLSATPRRRRPPHAIDEDGVGLRASRGGAPPRPRWDDQDAVCPPLGGCRVHPPQRQLGRRLAAPLVTPSPRGRVTARRIAWRPPRPDASGTVRGGPAPVAAPRPNAANGVVPSAGVVSTQSSGRRATHSAATASGPPAQVGYVWARWVAAGTLSAAQRLPLPPAGHQQRRAPAAIWQRADGSRDARRRRLSATRSSRVGRPVGRYVERSACVLVRASVPSRAGQPPLRGPHGPAAALGRAFYRSLCICLPPPTRGAAPAPRAPPRPRLGGRRRGGHVGGSNQHWTPAPLFA